MKQPWQQYLLSGTQSTTVSGYNETFGVLSALGIIFVVLGHFQGTTLTAGLLMPYYSFHMQLFAFISGYFFKTSVSDRFPGKYIGKKFIHILLPYFGWNVFYLALQTLLHSYGITIGKTLTLYNVFVYPFVRTQPGGFHVASWFLLSLFLIEVVNCLCRWLFSPLCRRHPHLVEWTVLVLYGALAWFAVCTGGQDGASEIVKILCRTAYLLLFYELGHWYHVCAERFDRLSDTVYLLLMLAFNFLLVWFYDRITVGVYNCSNFLYWPVVFLAPCVGIAFWLRIAKIITPTMKKYRWFTYLGKHTMQVMMHHLTAVFFVKTCMAFLHKYTGMFRAFDMAKYKSQVYYLFINKKGMPIFYAVASIALVLCATKLWEIVREYIRKKWRHTANTV